MSELLMVMWGFIGFIFVMAGKDFLEVFACFLLFSIFMGVSELHGLRKDLGNFKFKVGLKPVTDEELKELMREDKDDRG